MNYRDVIFIVVIYFRCVSGTAVDDVLHRGKRQLLFPNSTLLQFNAGIGTPSVAKDININFAFQANFQLPWNRSQIPVDILHANSGYDGDSRRRRDSGYENDAKLFHFYKYVEEFLNGFGHDGHSCVKQTLCQVGAQPLHTEDEDDLLHELASFLLNPTNDLDHQTTEKHESYPYIEAYKNGQAAKNCDNFYENCKISLVDMFSQLHYAT